MMIQLLILAGVLLLYFFFYYAFGALAVRLVPASDFSFARTTTLDSSSIIFCLRCWHFR